MARGVDRFSSFTCTPTHLSTVRMEWATPSLICLPSRLSSSFADPRRMVSWAGLGTTAVSKQSAQDRYVTGITVRASERSGSVIYFSLRAQTYFLWLQLSAPFKAPRPPAQFRSRSSDYFYTRSPLRSRSTGFYPLYSVFRSAPLTCSDHTVASCSNCHASRSNWSAAAMSIELSTFRPWAAMLTTEPPSHCNN